MKKLFLLAIVLFAVTSCEREISNELEQENVKNETFSKQSDSAVTNNTLEGDTGIISDVDPKDIILPPKR